AYRIKIEAEFCEIQCKFAGGLHTIDMEKDSGLFCDLRDFGDWLNDASLVVGVHDGDEPGVLSDRVADVLRCDRAVGLRLHESGGNARGLALTAGVQDSRMLDRCSDDVISGLRRSSDGEVVRFGASTEQHEFLGATS